jgi:SanA protein
MFLRLLKKMFLYLFVLIIAAVFIFGLPMLIAEIYALTKTHSLEKAPSAPAAIVFGAGLMRDGSPTPILRDRVATAADLYFAGKVKKLLMSGDNRFIDYNEPGAMKEFALELGVPEEDIILDYAGRRTYDTCYRARHIFGLEQALIITQRYHLPRALMTCNGLGLKAEGVQADRRSYNPRSMRFWRMREIPASLVAFVEVFVTRPLPVLGDPEPIFADQTSNHIE